MACVSPMEANGHRRQRLGLYATRGAKLMWSEDRACLIVDGDCSNQAQYSAEARANIGRLRTLVGRKNTRSQATRDRTYAVVGFGEAKPPRILLLWAAYGGKAAVCGPQH